MSENYTTTLGTELQTVDGYVGSNKNATHPKFFIENGHILWALCQMVTVLCALFDLYLFFCVALFWWREIRNGPKNSLARHNWHQNDSHFGSTASRLATTNNNNSRRNTEQNMTRTPSRRNTPETMYRMWMSLLSIAASVLAILKCLTDQGKFYLAWSSRSDDACEVLNDVTEVGLYGLTMMCVYGFLWVRQWMFYHNPAVKNLIYRNHLIRFSRYFPVAIASLLSVLAVFHLIPLRYKADDKTAEKYLGCVSIYDITVLDDAWPIITYIILTTTFQMCLLALFLYPLLRRKLDAYQRRTNISPQPSAVFKRMTSSNQFGNLADLKTDDKNRSSESILTSNRSADYSSASAQPTRERMKAVTHKYQIFNLAVTGKRKSVLTTLRRRKSDLEPRKRYTLSRRMQRSANRAVIWTAFCLVSDVTMVTVSLYFGPGTPLVFITAMNNFNIVVNQLCLIATYSRWKQILFPVLCCQKYRDRIATTRADNSCAARHDEEGSPVAGTKTEKSFPSANRGTHDQANRYEMQLEKDAIVNAANRSPGKRTSLPESPVHSPPTKRTSL